MSDSSVIFMRSDGNVYGVSPRPISVSFSENPENEFEVHPKTLDVLNIIRFISTEPLLVSVRGVVCTLFSCSRWLMFVVRAGGMLRTQYVVALSAQ